jgi:lipopolysaccharide/colanic/teichoic acid biosynthesis glycosyltransferase
VKRVVDVGAAGAVLIIAAPLMAFIAVAIRLSMGSPVLFRQERLGLRERVFIVRKFRTMTHAPGLPDEERLSRLGRWLRRTSLDELPQLFDILRGEMSFVGPRPLLVRYGPFFRAEETRRHSVIPGLTGWAQIHGRNHLPWDDRLRFDTWYVDHWSLKLDALILLRTVMYVLLGRGVAVVPTTVMDDLDVERAGNPRAG